MKHRDVRVPGEGDVRPAPALARALAAVDPDQVVAADDGRVGWRVDAHLSGRTLRLQVSDKQGKPISSAKGIVSIYMRNRGETISFPLREVSAGTYQLQLTDSMTGEMTARVEFERDGARLNRQLLLSL